jgi:hypothetical protein
LQKGFSGTGDVTMAVWVTLPIAGMVNNPSRLVKVSVVPEKSQRRKAWVI